MPEEEKRFDEWNLEKKRLHDFGRLPDVKSGEIWWCAVGENVGVEINGKGRAFMRPVLIYKKLSKFGFIGVPLTSQPHNGNWCVDFRFKGKMQYTIFAQIRNISVKRLYRKMGYADDIDMLKVRDGLKVFLFD